MLTGENQQLILYGVSNMLFLQKLSYPNYKLYLIPGNQISLQMDFDYSEF